MGNVYNGEHTREAFKNFDKELTLVELGFLKYLFKEEQNKGIELFEQKNKRYDAAFFKQCEEDGDLSSVTMRLGDKLSRLKSLTRNPDIDPLDESVRDTLVDIANYATMALVYLEVVERDEKAKKV